jgi:hypothetical protein
MTNPEYPAAQQSPSATGPEYEVPLQRTAPDDDAPSDFAGRAMPVVPAYAQNAQSTGPIGQVRSTGLTMLLFFVTLGIWGFVYYYQTQEEMKRHSGEGLGGALALVLSIFVGVVSPFFLSNEVGNLYERRGQPKPVNALTALWYFPGILILVGPFIWFVQTNNALNDYWRSLGAS